MRILGDKVRLESVGSANHEATIDRGVELVVKVLQPSVFGSRQRIGTIGFLATEGQQPRASATRSHIAMSRQRHWWSEHHPSYIQSSAAL
jgi:hypothetical protein